MTARSAGEPDRYAHEERTELQFDMTPGNRFARRVFLVAGIYGVLVVSAVLARSQDCERLSTADHTLRILLRVYRCGARLAGRISYCEGHAAL